MTTKPNDAKPSEWIMRWAKESRRGDILGAILAHLDKRHEADEARDAAVANRVLAEIRETANRSDEVWYIDALDEALRIVTAKYAQKGGG